MNLDDYEPTGKLIDFTPRLRASQEAAAKQRQRASAPTEPISPPASPVRASQRAPLAVGAIAIIVLMLAATSYQLAHAPAPLQLEPTAIPAYTLAAPPTAAPAPTSAPLPTIRPTFPPLPTSAPPVGRGLTRAEPTTVPTDPPTPEPTPEPPHYAPVPAALDITVQDNGPAPMVTGPDACKVAAKGPRRCG